jgi:hypothetical protein
MNLGFWRIPIKKLRKPCTKWLRLLRHPLTIPPFWRLLSIRVKIKKGNLTFSGCWLWLIFSGNPVSLKNTETNEVVTEPLTLFTRLNEIAGRHGVGRIDIVENRFLGLKVKQINEILFQIHKWVWHRLKIVPRDLRNPSRNCFVPGPSWSWSLDNGPRSSKD